uniref:uncharacterized protein isoform X2 n=1 Tax=Myxine glutinosa TaxID=7769 RepID=UPI00358E9682
MRVIASTLIKLQIPVTESETIKMAHNSALLVQLQQKAVEGDALISSLKVQLADLHQKTMSKACEEKEMHLRAENKKLEQEISLVKEQLIKAEIRNGWEPDMELNPNGKVWEAVQPELRTNNHLVATYKGVPFDVQERGECRAQSMCDTPCAVIKSLL